MSVKDQVLEYLENNRGKDVSGQEMAQELNVSRNTIWKAINSLKEQGYEISSITKKGYRLSENSEIVSAQAIKSLLGTHLQNLNIICLDEIDSTNEETKRLISQRLDKPALIIANKQTAGKGRRGRSFISPSGGAYMSFVLQGNVSQNSASLITMGAAVAVCEALEELTSLDPKIKWVNDILVDGLKVCGILTEAIIDIESNTITDIILGIGINTSTQGLPKELLDKVGAIPLDRRNGKNELFAHIALNLEKLNFLPELTEVDSQNLMEKYRNKSAVIGKEVDCIYADGSTKRAVVETISDDGSLVILDEKGQRSLFRDGEISIRPL